MVEQKPNVEKTYQKTVGFLIAHRVKVWITHLCMYICIKVHITYIDILTFSRLKMLLDSFSDVFSAFLHG